MPARCPLPTSRALAPPLALALALAGCHDLGLESEETPKPPPRIAFTETTYDFGRVAQGTPVEHAFSFANQGGVDLSIVNLRAACDCTATLAGGAEVPPGGRGAVQARFDTDAAYGPQRRTVTVYSNDPAQRALLLTLTGEVLLDVAADPPRVYLGPVPPGAGVVREVALLTGADAVRVGAPATDAPQLAVQVLDGTGGRSGFTLTIGIAPDAPLGPFAAVVRVPTSSARHPVLRIPVTGIVTADAPRPTPYASLPMPGPPPTRDGSASGAAGGGGRSAWPPADAACASS